MTVATQDFLARLRSLDIHLAVEGGRLRVNAPKGAMTPALQQELAERKPELLAWLQQMRRPPVAPAARAPHMPLSVSQERIWKSIQMMPDSARFNMHLAFRLEGALDVHALERSLNEIVRRHESLRTAIVVHDGAPAQRVLPFAPFALRVQPCDEAEAHARVQRLIREPFDLAGGSPHRFALFALDARAHVLALVLHHMNADGWSWDVLLRELQTLYAAFRAGQTSPLPELDVQYTDFAVWQRELLSGARLDALRAFWAAQLTPPAQPLTFLRPSAMHESQRETLALRDGLIAQVAVVAQQHHATPFAVHLAAFFAALRAQGGPDDGVVCTPAACRTATQFERLIGYFNNLLPLRQRAGDPNNFRTLLQQTRDALHAAMEHQELPFDAIAALPGASQVSLTRAVFSMQGDAGWMLALDGLSVKRIPMNNALAVFDLFMTIDATQEAVMALLEYRAGVLDATDAQRLLRAYESALRALVAQPDRAVSDWLKEAGTTASAPQTSRPAYAPPQTPAQKQLVALWETHFNRAPIGIHDDFFALGGNSLLAFRLFGQIARDMNANLPLSVLYQHTTVERLAAVIEQQPAHRAWSSLVAIQPRGERPPFFGIHGQDGNVLFWRHLVKHLHPDQPFYGIQARGVDGYSRPLSRIEDMAALYLSEVQQAQPTGPYYMGGFSMGGEIAFEMARRIVAQGGQVNLLVMFDTGNPDRPVRKPATASPGNDAANAVSIAHASPVNRIDILQRKLMNHARRLSGMPPREQARYLLNDLGMRAERARLNGMSAFFRSLGRRLPVSILHPYLASTHMTAVLNYAPQPYAGRVTLFRSRQTLAYSPLNSPMGWEPLALGGLDVHLLDATHRIVDEEYAGAVGRLLQICLDKTQHASMDPAL